MVRWWRRCGRWSTLILRERLVGQLMLALAGCGRRWSWRHRRRHCGRFASGIPGSFGRGRPTPPRPRIDAHDSGKALGMTPRQTRTMVITSMIALGLLAGAIAVPIGGRCNTASCPSWATPRAPPCQTPLWTFTEPANSYSSAPPDPACRPRRARGRRLGRPYASGHSPSSGIAPASRAACHQTDTRRYHIQVVMNSGGTHRRRSLGQQQLLSKGDGRQPGARWWRGHRGGRNESSP